MNEQTERNDVHEARQLAESITQILEDKKAVDIEVLQVTEHSSLADFFIIASGNSTTHVHSLSGDIQALIAQRQQLEPNHVEGDDTSLWILLDYGDVIVHIFQKEERHYYNLEKLWTRHRPPEADGHAPPAETVNAHETDE